MRAPHLGVKKPTRNEDNNEGNNTPASDLKGAPASDAVANAETPEERAARIKEMRIKNLNLARAKAHEVQRKRALEKKAVSEDLTRDRKALREMEKEIERQKVAMKWAKLEAEKQKLERTIKRVVKPKKTLDSDDDASDDDDTEEEEEVTIKPVRKARAKKAVAVEHQPPPPQVVHDPIATMTTAQIRDDLRKMQLEIMAKQLWGGR